MQIYVLKPCNGTGRDDDVDLIITIHIADRELSAIISCRQFPRRLALIQAADVSHSDQLTGRP